MDRIAPTRRPKKMRPTGYQRWEGLLFLHWVVDTAALTPLLPEGLSLDTFDGKAYVGLVPFTMRNVRPHWAPRWSAFNFLETNVRTYVHLEGDRPGVFFFSLEAASRIAVDVARALWKLPYHLADMTTRREGDEVTYRSQRRSDPSASLDLRYRVGSPLGPSLPNTLEHFLLERYLLYVEHPRQGLLVGQVHHTPYPAKSAEVLSITDGIIPAFGLDVAPTPDLAHYSEGVDVDVFALRRVG